MAALLAGLILTFGLFEFGLRLAGSLARGRTASSGHGWTVLCLGDSFTYTGGGDSWPDQLARRFAAAGARVRVLNRGVPGTNSNQLADRIGAELDRWKPDAAIVQIGADNFWSLLPIRDEPLLRRLDRSLLSLRSWKLLKLLWVGIAHGSLRGDYRAARAPRDREEALETVRFALYRQVEHPDDWYRVQLGDPPEAPRVEAAAVALAEILSSEPRDIGARVLLGRWQLSRGDARAAARTFRPPADSPCHWELISGLAQALDRLEGEAAAKAALGGPRGPGDASGLALAGGGPCRTERRLAQADWRLWRGEPSAAAPIARALVRESPGREQAWGMLGRTLYELEDFDGAVQAFREQARLLGPDLPANNDGLAHALMRQWEARRAKDPSAPPPKGKAVDAAYAWIVKKDYASCVAATEERLRAEPLDASLFYTYAVCLDRAGRLDEAARLPERTPAVRENLMYRYFAAQRARSQALRRPRSELEAEQFRADMERIARAARSRGVMLVLASYPEEEYEPVRRAAQAWNLPYADFVRLFPTRFKSREDFLAPDRCHCNARGFALMAEEFHRLLSGLPGFPGPRAAGLDRAAANAHAQR
ncbi:MAG: hypothetical protein HY748_06615 [Elusimicrobia bacterium]|nr:hypothetical protein [Elusimicrobiota bacterium]